MSHLSWRRELEQRRALETLLCQIRADWNIKLIGVENERRREVKVRGLA